MTTSGMKLILHPAKTCISLGIHLFQSVITVPSIDLLGAKTTLLVFLQCDSNPTEGKLSRITRKPAFGVSDRSITNCTAQPQKMARGLKFQIWEVEGLSYMYLCRESKGADKLSHS